MAKIGILLLFISSLMMLSCHKDNEFEYPMILMGEVTNIDSSGATINFRVTDLGPSDIKEFGIIWDYSYWRQDHLPFSYSIKEEIRVKNYAVRINRSLTNSRETCACAFITNQKGTVYSKPVFFYSKSSFIPIINDFSPSNADRGDIIKINCENLNVDYSSNNVSFTTDNGLTSIKAKIINENWADISVLVPDSLINKKYKIIVDNGDKKNISTQEFTMSGAYIESIFPSKIGVNDSLTINGHNFDSNIENIKFYFCRAWPPSDRGYYLNDFKVFYASENCIKATAPSSLPDIDYPYTYFTIRINKGKYLPLQNLRN